MAEQTNSTIKHRSSIRKPYTVPYSTVQYSNTIPLSRVPQTNPPPPPLTKAPRESAKKKKVTWRENANGALPLHRPATSARSIVRGSRGKQEEGREDRANHLPRRSSQYKIRHHQAEKAGHTGPENKHHIQQPDTGCNKTPGEPSSPHSQKATGSHPARILK